MPFVWTSADLISVFPCAGCGRWTLHFMPPHFCRGIFRSWQTSMHARSLLLYSSNPAWVEDRVAQWFRFCPSCSSYSPHSQLPFVQLYLWNQCKNKLLIFLGQFVWCCIIILVFFLVFPANVFPLVHLPEVNIYVLGEFNFLLWCFCTTCAWSL